jgi:hypothetical protein
MLKIETNAVTRAAKSPDTFTASLDAFWPKHSSRMIDAMFGPSRIAYTLQGVKLSDDAVRKAVATAANCHIGFHHEELLTAAECKPSELADRVAAVVESWTSTTNQ